MTRSSNNACLKHSDYAHGSRSARIANRSLNASWLESVGEGNKVMPKTTAQIVAERDIMSQRLETESSQFKKHFFGSIKMPDDSERVICSPYVENIGKESDEIQFAGAQNVAQIVKMHLRSFDLGKQDYGVELQWKASLNCMKIDSTKSARNKYVVSALPFTQQRSLFSTFSIIEMDNIENLNLRLCDNESRSLMKVNIDKSNTVLIDNTNYYCMLGDLRLLESTLKTGVFAILITHFSRDQIR